MSTATIFLILQMITKCLAKRHNMQLNSNRLKWYNSFKPAANVHVQNVAKTESKVYLQWTKNQRCYKCCVYMCTLNDRYAYGGWAVVIDVALDHTPSALHLTRLPSFPEPISRPALSHWHSTTMTSPVRNIIFLPTHSHVTRTPCPVYSTYTTAMHTHNVYYTK